MKVSLFEPTAHSPESDRLQFDFDDARKPGHNFSYDTRVLAVITEHFD